MVIYYECYYASGRRGYCYAYCSDPYISDKLKPSESYWIVPGTLED